MDNEDSLNLTIGEDEANLLQGEVRIDTHRLGDTFTNHVFLAGKR